MDCSCFFMSVLQSVIYSIPDGGPLVCHRKMERSCQKNAKSLGGIIFRGIATRLLWSNSTVISSHTDEL